MITAGEAGSTVRAEVVDRRKRVGDLAVRFLSAYGVFIAIGVLFAVFSVLIPAFFSMTNITNILRAISITTVIAIGVTMGLCANAFNLAVAAVAGLASALAAGLMVWNLVPTPLAILFPLIVGGLVGSLIAFFVIRFRIDDLLASLPMMFIAQGAELTYTGGLNIYSNMLKPAPGGGYITAPGAISHSFLRLGQGYIGFVPTPVIVMLAAILVSHLFLNNTKWGRHLYATGGNMEAARLAGIPVHLYRVLAHVLTGVFAAMGGVMLTARMASAQSMAAHGLLLDCIAASFIGYAVLGAGKPNIIGTFTGAVLMGIMVNGLTMLNIPYTAQDIFKGLILLGALGISRMAARR